MSKLKLINLFSTKDSLKNIQQQFYQEIMIISHLHASNQLHNPDSRSRSLFLPNSRKQNPSYIPNAGW
jgi:hypothetical protein